MKKAAIVILSLISFTLGAQTKLEVRRCAAIDRDAPVQNIYVDENENKWVADQKGLFLAQSPEFASPVDLNPSEWSLLSVPDGNQELNLPKASLQELMGENFQNITTANLDKSKQELWIGTSEAGLFHFKINPRLELIENLTINNSKLRSNNIQCLASTDGGQVFAGTDDGLLVIRANKTELLGKFFTVDAIAYYGGLWILSDGEVLEIDDKGKLYALVLESRLSEGRLVDIDFDSQGLLWLASEVVVRYNIETEDYNFFGPAQEFTSQNVNCIAVDGDDALWVGTRDKGVYYIGKGLSMSASVVVQTPLSCEENAKNAALRVRASGGQPPYTYTWEGGLKGENPGNLGVGTYAVTVTDQAGRTVQANATVESNNLRISVSQQKEASLGGGKDGQAKVTIVEGNSKYTYKWDNGETSASAQQLPVGTHQVTVTGDDGCKSVGTVDISEKLAPLELVLEQTQTSNCQGQNGGAIQAKASGGQGPYTYQWSAPNLQGEQVQQVAAGAYTATVTDANQNTATAQINIEEPEPLNLKIEVLQSATTNNADGQAQALISGGNAPYTFKWDTNETTDKANQLKAGNHTLTVTDQNGCTTSALVSITEDILPLAVKIEQTAEIKCAGEATAAVKAVISGGKSPYKYNWNLDQAVKEQAQNLEAGDYQLTITDVTGTTATAAITIVEPEAHSITVAQRAPANTNQADGKATIKAKGGIGKFTFKWDTGETGTNAERLEAGTHTIVATDEAGCTTTTIVDITEDILPLSVNIQTTQDLKCSASTDGALIAEISGGKPPFKYSWSNGQQTEAINSLAAGSYVVSITDAAGATTNTAIALSAPKPLKATITPRASASINSADGKATVKAEGGTGKFSFKWDSGETEANASQLAAGQRTVTVTDENGCTTSASIEITENILPLSATIQTTQALKCSGATDGTLAAEVNGGKPPFQFTWSNGQQSATINGLGEGSYQVNITDATGATTSAEASLRAPKPLKAAITIRASASVNNADGKATVKAEGGTGKFSFKWDTGETEANASQLAAGQRTVTVTDGNGCTTTASIEVTENILPLFAEIEVGQNIRCAGDASGQLKASISGGKPPYQYQWSTPNGQNEQANNLAAGDYELTVTDAAGGQQKAQVKLSAPAPLAIKVSVEAPASTNNADGQAIASGQGGTGDYSFKWDNGETSAKALQLAPGTHTVTITDQNSCTSSGTVEITENILPLTLSLSETGTIQCAGQNTAGITASAKGGKPPYKYQWNSSKISGENASNLGAGTYSLTLTDASGLSMEESIEIKAPGALTVEMDKNSPATNADSRDGKASLKVNGGTPGNSGYTYNWDNGETAASAEKLTFGPHSVTVTDANGCSANISFETEKKILPALTAGRLQAGQTLQVSRLYFEADSTNMTEESFPVLEEIANFLEENPLVVIEVGGHTNNIPPHEYCDMLSSERAKSVARYIVTKGVDTNRVLYKGYGKRNPIYSNRTDDGRRKNQRVEIKILRIN